MSKEKLCDATYQLFSKKGYEFSMLELSKAVGLGKSSLYNYFFSKEELIQQVIERELTSFFKYRRKEMAEIRMMPIETQLRHTLFSGINHFLDLEKLRFWKRMLLIEDEPLHSLIRGYFQENEADYIVEIQQIFHESISAGLIMPPDVRKAIFHFVALSQGMLEGVLFNSGRNLDYYFESVWESYWNGMKGD